MEPESEDQYVLLLEGEEGKLSGVADRLRELGVGSIRSQTPEEAQKILRKSDGSISTVLLAPDLPVPNLRKMVKSLRRAAPPQGLGLVVVGPRPEESELKKLRRADLEHALWEPFDDGTLRFQINRVFRGAIGVDARHENRVPTYLKSRIHIGGRAKDAVVYSLSASGAFLETKRASMPGAGLEVELCLPSGAVTVQAEVIYSNVVGNLQRPNAPLGMGVRFVDIPDDAEAAIRSYVAERDTALNI